MKVTDYFTTSVMMRFLIAASSPEFEETRA